MNSIIIKRVLQLSISSFMKNRIVLLLFVNIISCHAYAFSGLYRYHGVKIYFHSINDTDVEFEGAEAGFDTVRIPSQVVWEGKTYKVTSIGQYAFQDSKVRFVSIPNSVTQIKREAFRYCSDLTTITIPSSVSSIGKEAFRGCKRLSSIIFIGNSDTQIEGGAFEDCDRLTSVHINDLATWCSMSFGDGYANPLYYAHCLFLNGKEIKDLIVPNDVTSIGPRAFFRCNLETATIGNGVTTIGSCAFQESSLISATIPGCVKKIDYNAFNNCSSLSSVIIDDGVQRIGDSAFEGCIGLTSLILPNSVYYIGTSAFEGCAGLTSLTLPNNKLRIGSYAFKECTGLTSLTIPNAQDIYYGAFQGCTGLTSLNLPNCEYDIWDDAFQGCTGLTSLNLPNGVRDIGKNAFYGCTRLTSLTLPSSVREIGPGAFCNIDLVTVISMMTPKNIGYYLNGNVISYAKVFSDHTRRYATLYVPVGTKKLYSRKRGWEFTRIIEGIPNGITGVEKESPKEISRFTMDGKRVSNPQKGISIIKYTDGTTRKEMVK